MPRPRRLTNERRLAIAAERTVVVADPTGALIPKFMQITAAANAIFGLKNDGTIWKANPASTPLVWTQV